MDVYDKAHRSRVMASVPARDTKPEVAVRKSLHRLGFRFRLSVADLPGRPDIVLPRWNAVIFVHGCFWHQHVDCKRARRPSSNKRFWTRKLNRNVQRDVENTAKLESLGWRVGVVWECQIRDQQRLATALNGFLRGRALDLSGQFALDAFKPLQGDKRKKVS